MQTGTKVDGYEVLAVVAKNASELVGVSQQAFSAAVRNSEIGRTQMKRYFLKEKSTSLAINPDSDDTTKKSCCAIFLKDLPLGTSSLLQQCKTLHEIAVN